MNRHFDPLRPNRFLGGQEKYEFTHGEDSVCVYDIHTMDFVKEIPIGKRPDCHSTSADNRYLYMACGEGLYCIDQQSLEVVKVVDTGHVYATNVLPDSDTMLLHDAYGGFFVLKDISDMDKIRVEKRVDVLKTNTVMDTLGGKGHFINDGRHYLCAAWEHSALYTIDLLNDYEPEVFMSNEPLLWRGDDLVVSRDKTRAYVACHLEKSHIAVVDISERRVIKTIPTGHGSCGVTMSNDERYVITSNDYDNSISVIDTTTDELAQTLSAAKGFEELGVSGLIQGISIGQNDEVFVYGCAGSGALVRFEGIGGQGRYTVSSSKGQVSGFCS